MKAIRLAISNLRINFGNFAMLATLYLMLPLMISFFMSFTFTGILKEEGQAELKLQIVDEDQSEASQAFVDSLLQSQFIALSDVGDGDYELTFPPGFGAAQLDPAADPILPQFRNIDGGSSGEELLTRYINELGRAQRRAALTDEAIDRAGLEGAAVADLRGRLVDAEGGLGDLFQLDTVSEDGRDLAQAVTDQYALGFLSYILIMFVMSIPASTKIAQKSGLYGRIHTTPSTKADIMVADFLSLWCLSFVILLLYILIHRAVSGAFSGNLLIYVLMMLVYSGFAIGVATLLSALVPNTNIMTAIFTFIMILQVMSVSVGGMLTLGEESPVSRLLDSLRIDRLWIGSLERNREGLYGTRDYLILLVLAVATVVCLGLATLRENHRKEVRL